jgi:hypothetical protein
VCNDDPFCSMEDRSDTIGTKCSRSMQGNCVLSQFSKLYLMYSATDAVSAALDFSKGNVEDGVVDSPASRTAGRTPICSPSPLRDCQSTPIRQRSRSPMHQNVLLKGNFIAKHHFAIRRKPRRRILFITASKFPEIQD